MRHYAPVTEDRSWVRVGEVDLYVVTLGRPGGTPLVVLHGGPDWDHSYLLGPMRRLAAERHVVLFDLRGCGRSTRGLPMHACQPEGVMDDLQGLIDWLGVQQIDLLGFSYGGQLAVRFLADHRESVRKLVLASTGVYDDDSSLQAWTEYRARAAHLDVQALLDDPRLTPQQKTERLAETTAPLDIWDLSRLSEYRRLLRGIIFSGDWMRAWRSGTLRKPLPANPEDLLRNVGRTVCLLHGAQDMRFPVEHARRLHRAAPQACLVVIADAGHMTHFEQPARWAVGLRRFLA